MAEGLVHPRGQEGPPHGSDSQDEGWEELTEREAVAGILVFQAEETQGESKGQGPGEMPYSKIPGLEGFCLLEYKSSSCGSDNHGQVLQLKYPCAADHQDSSGPGGLEGPHECLLEHVDNWPAFLASLVSYVGRGAGQFSAHKFNHSVGGWQGSCNKSFLYACLDVQSCPTLCNPMYCSPPGSSVHRILWARIPERVAMPSSRGSSCPSNQTQVFCVTGCFFTDWANRDPFINYLFIWLHQV